MAGKRGDSLDDLLVSQTVLAGYFGMAPNSISRLVHAGLPRDSRGQYPLLRCCQWLFRRLRDRALAHPEGIAEERVLLIKAQREGQELENAANRAALLSADFVAAASAELVRIIGAHLDALPLMAPELARHRDPSKIAALLFAECRAVRERAAGDVEAFAKTLSDDD